MAQRCASLLFIMTRAALGSIALPLSLVLGMLAAPVTCQCGSPLPHDHSLFILGTHTHDSATGNRSAHSHGSESSGASATGPRNASEVHAEGPALRAPTDYAAGQPRALALPAVVLTLEAQESERIADSDRPRTPHTLDIEPPPPQA